MRYTNGYLGGSEESEDKLNKVIDLTTQSSQTNDAIIREIQDTVTYMSANDPERLIALTETGFVIFTDILKRYDEITINLATVKSNLNQLFIPIQPEEEIDKK